MLPDNIKVASLILALQEMQLSLTSKLSIYKIKTHSSPTQRRFTTDPLNIKTAKRLVTVLQFNWIAKLKQLNPMDAIVAVIYQISVLTVV